MASTRPRDGVGWIVLSSLVLPVGWAVWLATALDGDFGPMDERLSLRDEAVASTVNLVLCATVPVVTAVLLFVFRRRGRGYTWVGPVGCGVIAALVIGTLGVPTTSLWRSVHADADRRAQPLTAAETAKTPGEAGGDLREIGSAALAAFEVDPADGVVSEFGSDCVLSNLEHGQTRRWKWYATTVPADQPRSSLDRERAQLSPEESEAQLRGIRERLEEAGMSSEDDGRDGGLVMAGDGWLQHATVGVSKTDHSVILETRCFAKAGSGSGSKSGDGNE